MAQGRLSRPLADLPICFGLDIQQATLIKEREEGADTDPATDDPTKGEEKWQTKFYLHWTTQGTL